MVQDLFAIFRSPNNVRIDLAARFKNLRRELKISQRELAKRSGVSYGSIMRFEQEGQISLESLLKIAAVCSRLPEFDQLFLPDDKSRIEKLFDTD